MTEFSLDYFKMGYIILYKRTPGFIGNQIYREQVRRGFDKEDAEYVHVEISGAGKYAVRINPPKAMIINLLNYYKGRYVRVYTYIEYDLYKDKTKEAVAYFSATMCNRKYDIKGVLRFIFPFIKQNTKKPFCSEGCAWAIQKVFPKALHFKKPHNCMPADFTDPDQFTKVWEGQIPG